jgi:Protein of unknown function (DUF4065)
MPLALVGCALALAGFCVSPEELCREDEAGYGFESDIPDFVLSWARRFVAADGWNFMARAAWAIPSFGGHDWVYSKVMSGTGPLSHAASQTCCWRLPSSSSGRLPLELQKLLYFAHAIFLIETGDPLVYGCFEAWQYGPVHPAAPMRERPGWTGPRLRRSRRWGGGSGSPRSRRTSSQITTCCDARDSLPGQTGHIRSLCSYPWLERISN